MAVIELVPRYAPFQEAKWHTQAFEKVEAEFKSEPDGLLYSDARAIAEHAWVFKHRNAFSKLTLRQQFILKFTRMCDEAGVIIALSPEPYITTLARCYVGSLYVGDRTACIYIGEGWPEDKSIAEKCLSKFVEPFDDVHRLVGSMVEAYLARWPDTPIAKYARLNLGRVPERSGNGDAASEKETPPPSPPPAEPRPRPLASKEWADDRPSSSLETQPLRSTEPERAVQRPAVRAELILAPLIVEKFIPSSAHNHVIDYVENELSNSATTLIHVDERGLENFYQIMEFKRPVGTLPQRHLFCLKWLRMMEYAGILLDLVGADRHNRFLSQMYVGILHADGKASVTFTNTRQGGSWWEENVGAMQQQCLNRFTPSFDDVFSETVEMINGLSGAFPDSAMSEYGLRHLKGGSSGGWATSR